MWRVGAKLHASFTFVVDHSMFWDVSRRLCTGEFVHPYIKLRRAHRTVPRKGAAGKPRPYPVVRAARDRETEFTNLILHEGDRETKFTNLLPQEGTKYRSQKRSVVKWPSRTNSASISFFLKKFVFYRVRSYKNKTNKNLEWATKNCTKIHWPLVFFWRG